MAALGAPCKNFLLVPLCPRSRGASGRRGLVSSTKADSDLDQPMKLAAKTTWGYARLSRLVPATERIKTRAVARCLRQLRTPEQQPGRQWQGLEGQLLLN